MQRGFHGRAFCAAFAAALIAFTIFALLDTFVIPHRYAAVPVQAAAAVTTDETATAQTEAPAVTQSAAEITETPESADTADNTAAAQEPAENAAAAAIADSDDGGTVIGTYSDDHINITIKQYREHDTDIYLADVQLSSAEYLKTALAQNTYGRNIKEPTSAIASEAGAIFAVNGDFYGAQEHGFVIRNGVLYRDSSGGNDALAIMADGSLEIVQEDDTSAQSLLDAGAQQVLSFGPGLLENSTITVTENDEIGNARESNPRTAIAQLGNLHYLFMVSDGRTDQSAGLSLYEVAQFLQAHGAVTAYNLDGGGSSTMVFQGTVINIPTDGNAIEERNVSDIVYIG